MVELRNVVFVDDDLDVQTMVSIALEELGGLNLTSFTSGIEFLEAIDSLEPQLILMDMMMPGKTGLAVLEEMNELGYSARFPLVFMTAKAQDRDIEKYLGAGALDVLVKPFDPLVLSDQLREIWNEYCAS